MTLELRPLSDAVGVEVLDLDLRGDVPPAVVEELVAAWRDHHLVLLRGQQIDNATHARVASWFGTIDTTTTYARPNRDDPATYISNTRPEGRAREGSLLKHQDYCFSETLLPGLSLYAEVVPERGGETIFVNSLRAYEGLPDATKQRIAELHARHVYDPANDFGTRRFRLAEVPSGLTAVHPVVLPHPVSGRPILFVNELMTDSIVELHEDASESLLHELFAAFDDPAITYRHRWQVADLIVWDNLALQHGRTEIPPGQRRSLRRVQIA
ncbi:MAG TPA: TauD/TfdA family dioxygenase [Acidimicrobiales bacterium]